MLPHELMRLEGKGGDEDEADDDEKSDDHECDKLHRDRTLARSWHHWHDERIWVNQSSSPNHLNRASNTFVKHRRLKKKDGWRGLGVSGKGNTSGSH